MNGVRRSVNGCFVRVFAERCSAFSEWRLVLTVFGFGVLFGERYLETCFVGLVLGILFGHAFLTVVVFVVVVR